MNWRLPPNTCVDNRLDGKTIYTTDYIDHNAPTRRTKYEVSQIIIHLTLDSKSIAT